MEIKIKLFDKQRSLDAINNMLGFDAPLRAELTGKDGKDLFPDIKIEIIDKTEDVRNDNSDNESL